MKVIILAAGRGSRLGERTKDRPKCMVEICGKTILERCISTLEEAGIHREDIAIVTGYRKDLIRVSGVHYFHNKNWEQTNMFLSMMEAKEWLKAEPCLVCYSDVIFSAHAIKSLAASDAPLAVTYYTGFWELWQMRMEDPLSDLESFKIDSQNMLLEIGKKPHAKEDIMGQYMGLIRFTPTSFDWVLKAIEQPLPKPLAKLDMTTLLQGMLEQGYPIHTIAIDDLWLECDTQEDIEAYESHYQDYLKG